MSDQPAVRELTGLQIASLMAFKGQAAALAEAVRSEWGVALPETPKRIVAGDLAFIWAGPGRWLVVSTQSDDLETNLRACLDGCAAITDQGAGRTTFRVSGTGARAALAKLIGLDLHPRAFAAGDTALTIAAHMNVQLWQVDDLPTYDITVFRSLGESFRRALLGFVRDPH